MKHDAMKEENARLHGDLLTVANRISHDLRTPLGGIVTSAELLREILAEHKQPTQMTRAILDSVDEMTRLIKQISVVTRATANPIAKESVQMSEIVSYALARMEGRIVKKSATVIQPDSWPRVNGVAAWLQVIWENFLMNALQHSTKKPHIELSWREEEGFHRFGISDNGGGVPDQIRPGLFQPFNLLHQPDGAKGLGLSIVQRLVELQDGKCGYEPISDGSLFYFSLPR